MTTPPYPQGQPPQNPPYFQGQYPQGQPPQNPPYPQGQYAQAPQAGPAASGSGAAGGRNPLALVSVILGAVPLLLTLISPFATLGAASSDNFALIGVVSTVFSGIAFVFGVAALITGLIAVFRRGAGKALAGIGTGLGIAATWGALTGFLYPVVMSLGGY